MVEQLIRLIVYSRSITRTHGLMLYRHFGRARSLRSDRTLVRARSLSSDRVGWTFGHYVATKPEHVFGRCVTILFELFVR
ncbi:BnaCnng37140D [Brassica napus]|uniref:BnaCnng37140D protein n=1 Tax=Brassica napus TaxID=3708 RepID=A0A078J853_BRANA|nr:BnaCnng37140D [Brassica napus]